VSMISEDECQSGQVNLSADINAAHVKEVSESLATKQDLTTRVSSNGHFGVNGSGTKRQNQPDGDRAEFGIVAIHHAGSRQASL
jgi:hypothetical protein